MPSAAVPIRMLPEISHLSAWRWASRDCSSWSSSDSAPPTDLGVAAAAAQVQRRQIHASLPRLDAPLL